MGNEQQGFQVPTTRSDDRSQSAPKSIFGAEPVLHGDTNPEPSYKKQLSGLTGYKFGVNDQRNYNAFAEDRRQFAIATSGGVDLAPHSDFSPADGRPRDWVFGSSVRDQPRGPVSTYKTYAEMAQPADFGSTRVASSGQRPEARIFDTNSPGINNLGSARTEAITSTHQVAVTEVVSSVVRQEAPRAVIFGSGTDTYPMKPGPYAQARGQASVIEGSGVNAVPVASVKRSIFGENNYRGGYEASGNTRSKSVAVAEELRSSDRINIPPASHNRLVYEGGNGPTARGEAAVIYRADQVSGISDTFARNNVVSERSLLPEYGAYMDKNEFRNQVEEGRIRVSANFKQEDAEILATRANPSYQSNYRPSPSDYKFAEPPVVSSSALKYVPDAYQGVSVRSNLVGSERSQLHTKQISSSNFYEGALGRKQARVNAAPPPTSEGYEAPEYVKSNRIFDDNTKTSRIYLKDASIQHLEAEMNARKPYIERNEVVQEFDQPIIKTKRYPNEEYGKVASKVSGEEFEDFLETNRRAGAAALQPLEAERVPSDFKFAGNSPLAPPIGPKVAQAPPPQTQGRDSILRQTNKVVASELELQGAPNNLLLSQANMTGSQIHRTGKAYLPIETGDFEHAKFASAIKQDRFRAREGISAEKLKVNSQRMNLASQEGGLGINLRDIKPSPFVQPAGVAILTNKVSAQATEYVNQAPSGGPMTISRTVVATPDVSHGNNPAFQPSANSFGQHNSLRSFQVDPFGHPAPLSFPNLGITSPQGNLQGLATAATVGSYSQGISNPSRFKVESDAFGVPQIAQPVLGVDARHAGLLSNQGSARANEVVVNSPTYPGNLVAPNMNTEYPSSSMTSSLKIGELGGDFGAKIDRAYATYNPTPLSPIVSPGTANLKLADAPNQGKLNTDGLNANYNLDNSVRRQTTNEIIANMKPVVYQADIKSPGLAPSISPINNANFQNDFTPRDAELLSQFPPSDRLAPRSDFQQPNSLQLTPVPPQASPFANLKNGVEIGSSRPQASPVQTGQSKTPHYFDTVNIAPAPSATQSSQGIFQSIKDKIVGSVKDLTASGQQASIRNGYGTVSVPGEYTYEGLFVNGMFHGNGNIKYPDGTTFAGEFKNNRKEGHGRLYAASGQILREGLWVNDQPI